MGGCFPRDSMSPHPRSTRALEPLQDAAWQGLIRYHPLDPAQEHILLHAGTEPPGSGAYIKKSEEGIYLCLRCDHPLFLTSDQIPSHCGWPSFDEALPSAVHERLDHDAVRTEVLCNRCGGHLGHVFMGERFTEKNQRYCINSLALRLNPAYTEEGFNRAIFAAGCFWGVQKAFDEVTGVLRTQVGYTSGRVADPSYREVCEKNTGHAEAVLVIFDQGTSYLKLLDAFFKMHDPTLYNRQGPDIGTQYRSACFYLSAEQRDSAVEKAARLRKEGINVVTEITAASLFYPAESYHQKYYQHHKMSCS